MPFIRAVSQHVACISQAIEGAQADIGPVCHQTETGKEPEKVDARDPEDFPNQKYKQGNCHADNRPRPYDKKGFGITGKDGA